ncbi:MAG TPA: hypothetical protein DDW17_00315 [Deltaproteobacteria bacterium]|nr:hypothetical protein [Deltaproteobacteria bacterium]
MRGTTLKDRVFGGFWSAIVGDTLGVPVEFSRQVTFKSQVNCTVKHISSGHKLMHTLSNKGVTNISAGFIEIMEKSRRQRGIL